MDSRTADFDDWVTHWPRATATAPEAASGFHETWQFNLNDSKTGNALLVRFSVLLSANGFQRVTEVLAVAFEKQDSGELIKTAARTVMPADSFSADARTRSIQSRGSYLRPDRTEGSLETKGATLSWNLAIDGNGNRFDWVPELLKKTKLIRHRAVTLETNPAFTGTFSVNGREIRVESAHGRVSHHCGPTLGHEWIWGHCSNFVDADNRPADLVFDGVTARMRIAGRFAFPPLSALYFEYRGERHEFSTFRDLSRLRSRASFAEWEFRAERKGIAFQGLLKTGIKDFAGLSLEDTDGSQLHSSVSLHSDLTLLVFRDGKLSETLYGKRCAAFENVLRKQTPYVSAML